MMSASHPWPHLEAPLLEVLEGAPEGLSEFDLIRTLQRDYDLPEFPEDALSEPAQLYRTHFILFHVLYRLDERLPEVTIEVGCLRCRLRRHPGGDAGTGSLDAADPVRGYYLDLGNLDLEGAEVERLMQGFWRLLERGDGRRESALAVLGLRDPVTDAEIKAAYRRLAMVHHPDRGGDTRRLQELNEAAVALGIKSGA